ncbi:hypothetical protein [Burkholderia contaminans]|uniref:hypothetical protein n=1 Tax=Burkholderia contaminans TaxID=488447 RepID=UPI00158B236D|nr:hypothetical protein [Burkholderia contaminans]
METQKEEFQFFKHKEPREVRVKNGAKHTTAYLLLFALSLLLCVSAAQDLTDLLHNPRVGILGKSIFGSMFVCLLLWNASITLRHWNSLKTSASKLWNSIWKKK